jgi:hypothetical protein
MTLSPLSGERALRDPHEQLLDGATRRLNPANHALAAGFEFARLADRISCD